MSLRRDEGVATLGVHQLATSVLIDERTRGRSTACNPDPPDHLRAWEAVSAQSDHASVQAHRTVRTLLTCWHRWVSEESPIMHAEDYTEVEMSDGMFAGACGRIIADDGSDVTQEYLSEQ